MPACVCVCVCRVSVSVAHPPPLRTDVSVLAQSCGLVAYFSFFLVGAVLFLRRKFGAHLSAPPPPSPTDNGSKKVYRFQIVWKCRLVSKDECSFEEQNKKPNLPCVHVSRTWLFRFPLVVVVSKCKCCRIVFFFLFSSTPRLQWRRQFIESRDQLFKSSDGRRVIWTNGLLLVYPSPFCWYQQRFRSVRHFFLFVKRETFHLWCLWRSVVCSDYWSASTTCVFWIGSRVCVYFVLCVFWTRKKMEMLNSLNILAGKISPQNHEETTTTSSTTSASSADHSPSSR